MRPLVNNELIVRPLPTHVTTAHLFNMFSVEQIEQLFYFSEYVAFIPAINNRPAVIVDFTNLQIKVVWWGIAGGGTIFNNQQIERRWRV